MSPPSSSGLPGSVTTRALLSLAIPSAASAILNNAYRVIDIYAVQWLGLAAQAAIGASTFVLIASYSLVVLISAGAGPLVARATGGADPALRRSVVGGALSGAVGVGLLVSAMFFFGADQIAALVGLSGEPADLLALYLRALSLGGVAFAFGPLVDACFFAMGNARLPLLLQVVFTIANAALNGLFIYVFGWGIAGAALASVVSRAVTAGVGVWLLWREVRWTLADMWPSQTLRRIARIGLPVALNIGAYALVYWVLLAVVISPLGPAVNAALGVGFTALEGVAWPLFHGFELAVASMVGRQLGAGRPDLAEDAVKLALPWMLGTGLVVSAIFYFAAVPLCSIFTQDPLVLEAAVTYARILAFSQLFVAFEALGEGTLSGAGDTEAVFWWSVPLNILRIPLSWFLAFPLGWGAAGVWWAINITTYAKAAGKGASVIWGRWRVLDI